MSHTPSLDEDEIMRRRAFLRDALAAAGLVVAPGVLDAAARLDPIEWPGTRAARVEELETAVHARALDFPTVPTVDQLPALLRDYGEASHIAEDTLRHHHGRVYGCLSYLAAFVAANLSTWGRYDDAVAWYGEGLRYAQYAEDREAHAWIAGRATLIPAQQGAYRQAMHDGAYAAAVSPPGQLGATLGNALAAAAAARLGMDDIAVEALREAERAVEHRAEDTFTAFSLPWYRLGRFASETYTQLGDTRRAQLIQAEAVEGYPAGSTTDLTFLALDQADCLAQQGYPQEAARHATRTVLGLAPERAAPIMLDRAEEIADLNCAAGRSETNHLRHVVTHTRVLAAA